MVDSDLDRIADTGFDYVRIGEGASQPTKAEKRPSMMPKKAAADADKAGGTIGELIKQKLGAANQSELTLLAIRHGLIEA